MRIRVITVGDLYDTEVEKDVAHAIEAEKRRFKKLRVKKQLRPALLKKVAREERASSRIRHRSRLLFAEALFGVYMLYNRRKDEPHCWRSTVASYAWRRAVEDRRYVRIK